MEIREYLFSLAVSSFPVAFMVMNVLAIVLEDGKSFHWRLMILFSSDIYLLFYLGKWRGIFNVAKVYFSFSQSTAVLSLYLFQVNGRLHSVLLRSLTTTIYRYPEIWSSPDPRVVGYARVAVHATNSEHP